MFVLFELVLFELVLFDLCWSFSSLKLVLLLETAKLKRVSFWINLEALIPLPLMKYMGKLAPSSLQYQVFRIRSDFALLSQATRLYHVEQVLALWTKPNGDDNLSNTIRISMLGLKFSMSLCIPWSVYSLCPHILMLMSNSGGRKCSSDYKFWLPCVTLVISEGDIDCLQRWESIHGIYTFELQALYLRRSESSLSQLLKVRWTL